MVTDYNENICRYTIDKLDKVVFFVNKEAIGNISIDNGAAYVSSAASATSIECYAISLNEQDTLDERYEFNHSLNFSVQGYMNKDSLNDKYYAIVRDKEGTYWLLNPMLPMKVTYTYTIDAISNHTDFVISTKSNFPLLKITNFTTDYVKQCSTYNLCGIDFFDLNESNYSKLDGNTVYYTNDGFKEVKYNKDTARFTETYDGTNVSHSLAFNIKFDDYKSSWHYNLLEFTDNKYAVIIRTKCGTNIACGFGYGLQPSFTVTGSDTEINRIEITLSDLHDQGDLIHLPSEVPYAELSATTWGWVTEKFECISETTAKRLLMRKFDGLGNPLDEYQCLEGYEGEFSDYNIVGTFDEVVTFPSDACRNSQCYISTSIPSGLTFTQSGQCYSFYLRCESNWTASTSDSGITISPTSGNYATYYTVNICNNITPTSESGTTYDLTINYCDTSFTKSIIVKQASPSECFPQGQTYEINSDAQTVTIPTTCCFNSVSANTGNIKQIQIQDGYVTMYVDDNQQAETVTHTLTFTKCDGTTATAYIVQDCGYRRWVKEGEECYGSQKCDFERMYSGVTSGDVNTPTYITRYTNCVVSTDCQDTNTRWVESTYTSCVDGRLYMVEFMQIKYGDSWSNTGLNRLGRQIQDLSGQCSNRIEKWVETSGYTCNGTDKHTEERLYYAAYQDEPSSAWTPTDVYRMGSAITEYNSTDCGYNPQAPSYVEYKPNGDMCDGYNKYINETMYVSDDGNTWSATTVSRRGMVVQERSEDCGYESEYEYQWVEDSAETICENYNLYRAYKKQQRPYGSSDAWEDVIPTTLSYDGDGTMTPILIQSGSTECGYTPPVELIYRWVSLNPFIDYYCVGTTKHIKEQKQFSTDSGVTWTNVSPAEYRMDEAPYEEDSLDCGGGFDPIYKWEEVTFDSGDPTTYICDDCPTDTRIVSGTPYCDGVDKYQDVEEQISYDGGETWQTISSESVLIENNSYDCGYRVRQTSGTPYCNGYDKFQDVYYEYSTNSGSTWTTASTVPTLIEAESSDCGYIPQIPKFQATYSGGSTYSAACDSDRELDWEETRPNEYQTSTIKHIYMTEAIIGDCVTSIGSQAFEDCPSLTSVTIPSTVTSIGNSAFTDCVNLTSITVPSSVTYNGDAVFSGCSSLVTVTMPNLAAKDNMFANCSRLTSIITGPNGVTYIGEYAFYRCRSLTSITLANGVTSIGYCAFTSCGSLSSITIPSTVIDIYYGAFNGCNNLQSITCLPTTPPILDSQAFNNTNNCPIYVPAESVNTYKSEYPWSDLSDRIQAIPT